MARTFTPRFGLAKDSAGTDAFMDRATYNSDMQAIETLSAIDLQDLFANRPAAISALRGAYFWATDSHTLDRCDGTTWRRIAPGFKAVYLGPGIVTGAFSSRTNINSLTVPAASVPVLISIHFNVEIDISPAAGVLTWEVYLKVDGTDVIADRFGTSDATNGFTSTLSGIWDINDTAGGSHTAVVAFERIQGTSTANVAVGAPNVLQASVVG